MSSHYLKLNEDKTDVIVLTTPTVAPVVNIKSIQLGVAEVDIADTVRDLGIILDSRLKLQEHINTITKRAFHQLYRIGRIRKYLTNDTAKSLVHALVLSKLDYCNVLLYGVPDCLLNKLQRVQNHAARLITGTHKYDHITPALYSLHWLPVEQRITYKLLLLTFKALNGLAPEYICDLLEPYKPCRSLRSSAQNLLKEPSFRLKTYGARSFQCAAPRSWNHLPNSMRTVTNLQTFKKNLKTELFKNAYKC